MKNVVFLIAFVSLLWPVSLWAAVGQAYEDFKKGDLWTFFRMSESERFEMLSGHQFVRCKPGAFQDFIDVELILSRTGNVVQGNLYVARSWIANAKSMNPFAIDIVTSFVKGLVATPDLANVEPALNQIAKGPGKQTPQDPFLVYVNRKQDAVISLSACKLAMRNCKITNMPWLFVMVASNDSQLPRPLAPRAPAISMFLTEKELQPFGLKKLSEIPNPHMHVWSSGDPKALVSRVIDIRWEFPTAIDAQFFHVSNIRDNSESSQQVTPLTIPTFGSNLLVFMRGPEDPMLKAMKLDMNMYYFLFCHDKVVAKVFVAGSGKLTLADAAKIGQQASKIMAGDNEEKPK